MRSLQLMRDTDDNRLAPGDHRLDRLMPAIKGGSTRPRGSARAYLYRIVRHLVIDEKRKQGVRRRWAESQQLVDAPRPPTPAEELDAKVLADAFEAAVALLPDRRREVFELVFQRGLSHAEAAAVLDISVQTVANQMSAALRSVRRAIKED